METPILHRFPHLAERFKEKALRDTATKEVRMSYHDEIRELLGSIDTAQEFLPADQVETSPITQLREQAEKLLALPEESIDKLVQAAQLGVEAVQAATGNAIVTIED